MSLDDLAFRLFLAAWVIVLVSIVFVQLPRVAAQAIRIVRRLIALVADSPLPLQIAAAQDNLDRIDRAGAQLPQLLERAQTAVTVIRTTPLVPPAIRAAVAQIGDEVRAFRAYR